MAEEFTNLPDVIRMPAFTSQAVFAGRVAVAEEAGLHAWVKEHQTSQWGSDNLMKNVSEEFSKPTPRPEAAAWREEAGYEYGDALPDVSLALSFDRDSQETFAPYYDLRGSSFGEVLPDSGIRLEVGLPHKTDDETTVVLQLPVSIKTGMTDEGVINMPELRFHVGKEVGVDKYDRLSEKASQELSIVTQRVMQIDSGVNPADMAPRLPYHKLPVITETSDDQNDSSRQSGTGRKKFFGLF